MSFLLDTNICSAHLKRPAGLTHRFVQHTGRLYLPAIVLAELYTWAYRRPDPRPLLKAINDDILTEVHLLLFDQSCADEFGRVRAEMLKRGLHVGVMDLQIAVIGLVNRLTVVTHNTADFAHIPGLQVVDWLAP